MLYARGVGCADRVALLLPDGPEMAVAFLTVAANATCAPLNPAYSHHELMVYLAAIRAKALIVQAGLKTPAREVAQGIWHPNHRAGPSPCGSGALHADGGGNRAPAALHGAVQDNDVALVLPDIGHDVTAETRAAHPHQCLYLGTRCERGAGSPGERPLPAYAAPVSRAWSHCHDPEPP